MVKVYEVTISWRLAVATTGEMFLPTRAMLEGQQPFLETLPNWQVERMELLPPGTPLPEFAVSVKRGPGRPKGSTNKAQVSESVQETDSPDHQEGG
jgi:hypothetical protein